MDFTLNEDWHSRLNSEFEKPYFQSLVRFLDDEYANSRKIFPPQNEIFNALNGTAFEKVKVVILGQDPYHNDHQAHGLSFSVNGGVKIPASLKNIFKELSTDIEEFALPNHGNLSAWASQGVLLLNATLTVEAHRAGSHQNKGWEIFTDHIISLLSSEKSHLVFILWGNFAHKKIHLIDGNKHLILQAPHPSPLSAYHGFWGSKPFSKTNTYLKNNHIQKIDWQI